jgi:hypothetical protein
VGHCLSFSTGGIGVSVGLAQDHGGETLRGPE